MNLLFWGLAAFATVEGISVLTAGTDIFYPSPLPIQDRPLPGIEWLTGAAFFSVVALRTAPVTAPAGY